MKYELSISWTSVQLSSVPSLSCVRLFATPWPAARQASLSIASSWSLLRLTSIELVMPSNHLIHWHSQLLLPSIFPSIRVFSIKSVLCIRWPKYWNFIIKHQSFQWLFRTNSFKIDRFDLLAVHRTLESLPQHHSSETTVLQCSAIFMG